MQVVQIRQKILKCHGLGFSKAETVQAVIDSFKVSKRDVYWHLENQDKWMNDYFPYDDIDELRRARARQEND